MTPRSIARDNLTGNGTKENRRARLKRWLGIEHLESRNLLTGGFLQGTAFVDTNQNNVLDSGDQFKVGATINLRDQAGAFIRSTTTDTNGQYRFDNLSPATYRIEEIPTDGYVNHGTQILSQINPTGSPAVQISPSTIQATVVDPNSVYVNYLGFDPSLFEVLNITVGSYTSDYSVGVLFAQLGTAPGLSNLSNTFTTFCIDLYHDLSFEGGENFKVLPVPASTSLPFNGGQVSYLYNHFGRNRLDLNGAPMTSITSAGFQVAVWELEYDPNPNDILNGVFQVNSPYPDYTSAVEFAAIKVAAQDFINAAAGKSEASVVDRKSVV